LLEHHGERIACKTVVELLSLAHERGCEAELAAALSESLEAEEAPNLKALQAHFAPNSERLPQVCVQLTPLSVYEDFLGAGRGEAA
jgi:hypothetical protein